MTDEELIQELQFLGIDEHSYGLVGLLPLVQVAWADGAIQEGERKLIHDIAAKRGLADEAGMAVIDRWLEKAPSKHYLHRGRRVLAALVNRQRGVGADIDLEDLEAIGAFCEGVADAAGGLFGLLGRTSSAEREAIQEVVGALGIKRKISWEKIRDLFEEKK